MELIKRKILLEEGIDRNYNSPTYGMLTATSFFCNVVLMQNIDDMGLFTDVAYLPNLLTQNTPVDYTILTQKLQSSGFTFPFMTGGTPTVATSGMTDVRPTGLTVTDYYDYTNAVVTGTTDGRDQDVRSYSNTQPYQVGFDLNISAYTNYTGATITGTTRVTALSGGMVTYVFDTDINDPNIGTVAQQSGILMKNITGQTAKSYFSFIGEGWNQTNTTLSALTKEEYLFGIISKPEIKSDVFIDRGITTIFEKHLKLSEIRSLAELARYGRGYFNLTID